MKALIIVSGVTIGILFGIFPRLEKPKPGIWKALVILLTFMSIILTLLPPIANDVLDLPFFVRNLPDKIVNVYLKNQPDSKTFNSTTNKWQWTFGSKVLNSPIVITTDKKEFDRVNMAGDKAIVSLKYNKSAGSFEYLSTQYVNPLIVLPYVPSLEDRIRIMNFHVPVAWIAVLAYLISMIYSIQYLRTRNMANDTKAAASAMIGTFFCVLATLTGMIWAKFNWGSYWNWDPRETSILVLLLIYAAYFALRSSIEKEDTKARLSSVYSIIAFVTVPFFIFILPRITAGLHPGSQTDNNSGPVLSPQSDMMNLTLQFTFSLAFAAFTAFFFWLLNLYIRTKKIENSI
jgi:heme exporter protein C